MGKVFTCDVIQDPDDENELAIQFTDELMAETGKQAMFFLGPRLKEVGHSLKSHQKTLYLRYDMVEITEQEFQLFEKLKTILRQTSAEKLENVYFFCGEGGTKDEMRLPEMIIVCPSFGLDGFAMYMKISNYSAPGY